MSRQSASTPSLPNDDEPFRSVFRAAPEAAGGAGLYVHVPFCSAICPYCDFAVVRDRGEARARYVESLVAEIASWEMDAAAPDTVYLGGGTPSALDPEELAAVVDALRDRFRFADGSRVTLEANPEDVDRDSLAAWRALGVHTLSLGVQALDDDALRFLGRRHRRVDALRAVELALEAGFPVVSIDLIYAWPGHEVEAWRGTLREAAALGIHHLSCYELTVHEGTPFARLFARDPARFPGDDLRGDLFLATHRELDGAGWDGYEVSNFAREPDARSLHNQKYWRHAPYLGLGPSAHSFDGGTRWWNERDLLPWARALAEGRSPVAGRETIDAHRHRLEALMLGLRTREGVDLGRLRRVGEWDVVVERADELSALERAGLVSVRGERLLPSLEGMAIADGIALRLS